MQQLGYVDGKNYEVEAYFTGGNREMTQDVARKLVQEPVDVLLAVATPAIHIVNAATPTIPIVMLTANALATGLVSSMVTPRRQSHGGLSVDDRSGWQTAGTAPRNPAKSARNRFPRLKPGSRTPQPSCAKRRQPLTSSASRAVGPNSRWAGVDRPGNFRDDETRRQRGGHRPADLRRVPR